MKLLHQVSDSFMPCEVAGLGILKDTIEPSSQVFDPFDFDCRTWLNTLAELHHAGGADLIGDPLVRVRTAALAYNCPTCGANFFEMF